MGFFDGLLRQPAPVAHKHRHRRHRDHDDESLHHHSRRVEERMHSRPLYSHFDPPRLFKGIRGYNAVKVEPIEHHSRAYYAEHVARPMEPGLRAPQHRARPSRPIYRPHYEEDIIEPRRRRHADHDLYERRHEPEIRHHSRRQESDNYFPYGAARRHVPVPPTIWEDENEGSSRGKRRRHHRRRNDYQLPMMGGHK